MKKTALVLLFMAIALVLPAAVETTLAIKLDFFGPAAGKAGGPGVATSFYLKSMVQRNLQVKFTAESLLAELKKTFNAPDAALLASADLAWRSGGPASVMQIVQIDGRDIALLLTPQPKPGAVNFKVGVVENSRKDSIKEILLDTEIVLPDGEVAMLGFRDSRDRSYFIAFYVQGRDEAFGKNALRITGGKKPKIIKKVNPAYPEEAVKNKIQGVVVLEAVIDEKGKVSDVRTVTSATPILDNAAMEAVKQWEYAPFDVDGRCQKVIFTVTMTFHLNPEDEGKKSGDDVLTRLEGDKRPRKIKHVDPVYPKEAKDKKIEGTVILEAVVDEGGKVSSLKTVSSPGPLLADAAVQAVKQWVYEPFLQDGKAKKVAFTVTITFSLKKD